MEKIKIILADDHELMRNGLRTLLEKERDFEIVAEADTGRQAVALVGEYEPHVVVMDVTMPDMSGITATHKIVSDFPEVKVLGLSMHPVEVIVGEMLKAGAAGYLTKNCAADELVKAIHLIHCGKVFLSSEIAQGEIQKYLDPGAMGQDGKSSLGPLSHREKEVLQLVAEGEPTKAIAGKLFISEKTVGAHRQNIMNKLGIRSVAELTKFAIREGLTPLD
ncbi:MAG: response regulator transcription factor [Gemmatimonadales bacterium]|nr:response regulator transcription factor [Gemmatimonadales bacterium]